MIWSDKQEAIFRLVQEGKRSGLIRARAGTGKTTTIVEAASRVPPGKSAVCIAFNKAIATELAKRLPAHIPAKTFNAFGFRPLMQTLPRTVKLEPRKIQNIIRDTLTFDARKIYGGGLRKLVGLAKAHGLVPKDKPAQVTLTPDTEQNWVDLMERYDIEFEAGGRPLRGIEFAREILTTSIELAQQGVVIDFDDQLYLPVIWQLPFQQYDRLFVDETQDVNMIQRAIIRMSLKPEGLLYAVGDDAQSIYAFRGADCDAMENIKHEFDCVELPLSISYRCPRRIIELAQAYCPAIEAAPDAPEGEVIDTIEHNPETFPAGSMVLCRNNAPLVNLAFRLMRHGKPVKMLGRDFGEGIIRLIEKLGSNDLKQLDRDLDIYAMRETQALIAKGKEEQADLLNDRVETLRVFADNLPESRRTIADLIQYITELFANENGRITLSTVHKAKGGEWDTVFILDSFLMPSKWARQDYQKQQETNLQYVAVTRAKQRLIFINTDDWREQSTQEARV